MHSESYIIIFYHVKKSYINPRCIVYWSMFEWLMNLWYSKYYLTKFTQVIYIHCKNSNTCCEIVSYQKQILIKESKRKIDIREITKSSCCRSRFGFPICGSLLVSTFRLQVSLQIITNWNINQSLQIFFFKVLKTNSSSFWDESL